MFKNSTFSARTYQMILVPAIVSVITLALFGSAVMYLAAMNQLTTQGRIIGESIATGGHYYVLTGNMYEVKKLACLGVQLAPSVQSIEILSPTFSSMTACIREGISLSSDVETLTIPIRSAVNNPSNATTFSASSDAASDVIAYARVTMERQHVIGMLRDIAWKLLLTMVVVFTIGALISLRMAKNLAESLDDLVGVIVKVAEGNFEPVFSKPVTRETKALQSGIMTMAHAIANRSREFEDRVEERTRELLKEKEAAVKAVKERKALIQHMHTTIEEERRSVALDMHDTVNSVVISLMGAARSAQQLSTKLIDYPGGADLNSLLTTQEKNIRYVYDLSRNLVNKLRPEILDLFGLDEALPYLVKTIQDAQDCAIRFNVSPDFPNFGYAFNIVVYRIVQESLSNVVKHAKASICIVDLDYTEKGTDGIVTLRITDNGKGFDVANSKVHTGLLGMHSRAEGINGRLDIRSDDQGTELFLRAVVAKDNVPLPS